MITEIPLYDGGVFYIDSEDAEFVSKHKWHRLRTGQRTYVRTNVKTNGKWQTALLHRMLLDAPSGLYVDHINGNGLDNTRANLRLVNAQQNATNKTARGQSGEPGVRRTGGRWVASISPGGMEIYLGSYSSIEMAKAAADAAASRVYGEYRRNPLDKGDQSLLDAVIQQKREQISRLAREVQILNGGVYAA